MKGFTSLGAAPESQLLTADEHPAPLKYHIFSLVSAGLDGRSRVETKELIVSFHTKHRGPPATLSSSPECPQQVGEGRCSLVGLKVTRGRRSWRGKMFLVLQQPLKSGTASGFCSQLLLKTLQVRRDEALINHKCESDTLAH